MTLDIAVDPEKKLAIKVGDEVNLSTPLYKGKEKSEERICVAELLAIHPKKIFNHLKKNVGDRVKEGDLLAERKSFFSDKKISSHIEGIITEVDHIEGVVLIETEKKSTFETCWFAGHVEEISKKNVHIKIGKHTQYEAKYVEKDFGGAIWLFANYSTTAPEFPVGIAERANEYEVAKLEALGGGGLITSYKFESATQLPKAEFKLKSSYEELQSKQFSYCFAQAHHSTIIVYSV